MSGSTVNTGGIGGAYGEHFTWELVPTQVLFTVTRQRLTPRVTNRKYDDLLDQVKAEIDEVYLDGAYDAQTCHGGLIERDIYQIIPPPLNTINWYGEEPGDADDCPRNQFIKRINEIGRAEWKKEIGYHRRSLSETAMLRYKTIFGSQYYSRSLETQTQENKMKIKALNQMTAHGVPIS